MWTELALLYIFFVNISNALKRWDIITACETGADGIEMILHSYGTKYGEWLFDILGGIWGALSGTDIKIPTKMRDVSTGLAGLDFLDRVTGWENI